MSARRFYTFLGPGVGRRRRAVCEGQAAASLHRHLERGLCWVRINGIRYDLTDPGERRRAANLIELDLGETR